MPPLRGLVLHNSPAAPHHSSECDGGVRLAFTLRVQDHRSAISLHLAVRLCLMSYIKSLGYVGQYNYNLLYSNLIKIIHVRSKCEDQTARDQQLLHLKSRLTRSVGILAVPPFLITVCACRRKLDEK